MTATLLELPIIFIAGLLGSAHCVGMCGGFAVMIGGAASSAKSNLARQIVYSAGRIFTYAFLGATVGFLGMRLEQHLPGVIRSQAALAIFAGLFLVYVGLASTGLLTRRRVATTGAANPLAGTSVVPRATAGPTCLSTGLLGTYLRAPGWHNAFLAGVFTGFLPCGLVYAFLALAASAGHLATGAATMAAFGCGTVPLMIATGASASLLSLVTRQRLLRAAAWCVVLTGVLSVARGLMAATSGTEQPACPVCVGVAEQCAE